MSLLPMVGKPGIEISGGPRGKIHEQLCEIELWVDVMTAAATGQAGQDRCGSTAARVAYEEGVFAIEDHSLHLPFANIIIYGHGAIGGEHRECFPLAERVVHGVGHGMLR